MLLEKGYEVHGIIRRASVSTTSRIDHILDKLIIHEGDLSDSSSIIRIVLQVKPDEIYNLAAQVMFRFLLMLLSTRVMSMQWRFENS